jgi:hypothetical protein
VIDGEKRENERFDAAMVVMRVYLESLNGVELGSAISFACRAEVGKTERGDVLSAGLSAQCSHSTKTFQKTSQKDIFFFYTKT